MSDFAAIMWAPVLACLVLVAIHAYLGIHVLARGVIFVDLALAQIAALGATFAVLLGYEVDSRVAFVLSLAATMIGALLFSISRIRLRGVPQEAIIGVIYAMASSAAILAVNSAPHGAEHIRTLLIGSILWITPSQLVAATILYLAIGVFHYVFRRRFLLISFDPDEAERIGLRVRWWDFLFYASFGLVVTSSVKIAGVLLVFTFLIVPAIFGTLFVSTLRGRMLLGWSFGWLVSIAGCVLSYQADLPTGATVVCTFGVALLAALVFWKTRAGAAA